MIKNYHFYHKGTLASNIRAFTLLPLYFRMNVQSINRRSEFVQRFRLYFSSSTPNPFIRRGRERKYRNMQEEEKRSRCSPPRALKFLPYFCTLCTSYTQLSPVSNFFLHSPEKYISMSDVGSNNKKGILYCAQHTFFNATSFDNI